jgi:translation initiation factor IF-2
VATVLVSRGTLKPGDVLLAGTSYGRVRALIDPQGERVTEAKPADPVEVLGLDSVPTAGDEFRVFEDERDARNLAKDRQLRERLKAQETKAHMSLDDLFARIEEGKTTDLNLIVKADVQGSIEALVDVTVGDDVADIPYFLLNCWQMLGLSQTEDTLHIAGTSRNSKALTKELSRFVQHIRWVRPAEEFHGTELARIDEMPFDLQTLISCE